MCSASKCKFELPIVGEFFKCYKKQTHLAETFMLLYAAAHRWRPQQVREELKIQSGGRYTAIIDEFGKVARFALEYRFKSQLGTWEKATADESCLGKAVAHIGAKPGTKKGHQWHMSCAQLVPLLGGPGHKIGSFFFEEIPKLEVTDKNGNKKFQIKTTFNLCWHLERLVAKGGTVITDCAGGYKALGDTIRPDIKHLDSNHSKGFAVPGPKSIAAGVKRCDSSAIEGTHSTLYNIVRPWLGTKIGSGSDDHTKRVKDCGVFMMNCKFDGQDILQQLFLWMRYLYGSMVPTPAEVRICEHLKLEIGDVPDFEKIQAKFESIDIQKSPWTFQLGERLPELCKWASSMPAEFEVKFSAFRRDQAAQLAFLGSALNSPIGSQPPRLPLREVTSPFVDVERPRKRRSSPPQPADQQKNKKPAKKPSQKPEVEFHIRHMAAVEDEGGRRQIGLFGLAVSPPPATKRQAAAEVQFHAKHTAGVISGGMRQLGIKAAFVVDENTNPADAAFSTPTAAASAASPVVDLTCVKEEPGLSTPSSPAIPRDLTAEMEAERYGPSCAARQFAKQKTPLRDVQPESSHQGAQREKKPAAPFVIDLTSGSEEDTPAVSSPLPVPIGRPAPPPPLVLLFSFAFAFVLFRLCFRSLFLSLSCGLATCRWTCHYGDVEWELAPHERR